MNSLILAKIPLIQGLSVQHLSLIAQRQNQGGEPEEYKHCSILGFPDLYHRLLVTVSSIY